MRRIGKAASGSAGGGVSPWTRTCVEGAEGTSGLNADTASCTNATMSRTKDMERL